MDFPRRYGAFSDVQHYLWIRWLNYLRLHCKYELCKVCVWNSLCTNLNRLLKITLYSLIYRVNNFEENFVRCDDHLIVNIIYLPYNYIGNQEKSWADAYIQLVWIFSLNEGSAHSRHTAGHIHCGIPIKIEHFFHNWDELLWSYIDRIHKNIWVNHFLIARGVFPNLHRLWSATWWGGRVVGQRGEVVFMWCEWWIRW